MTTCTFGCPFRAQSATRYIVGHPSDGQNVIKCLTGNPSSGKKKNVIKCLPVYLSSKLNAINANSFKEKRL